MIFDQWMCVRKRMVSELAADKHQKARYFRWPDLENYGSEKVGVWSFLKNLGIDYKKQQKISRKPFFNMAEPELGTRTWSRSSTKFDVKGFQSISWKILKSKKSKSDLKILSQRFHIHIIKSIYLTDGMVHVQFHWISAIFSRVIKIFSFSALSRKSLKNCGYGE